MLQTIAIRGYRSLREIVLPLRRLTVVTGANGTGKSSLYRALRLLADCGRGEVIGSLAREGGLDSVLWAGPEQLGGARRTGRVEGTTRTGPVALELGFASDDFGYLVDLGLAPDGRPRIVVRVRPGDQARGGVRRRGDAHRLDPGAPNPRLRRGERGIRAGIRRGLAGRCRRIAACSPNTPIPAPIPNSPPFATGCAPGGSTTASASTRPHRRACPRSAPARPCCPTTAAIVAAAVQTIIEAGFEDLSRAVADAFDGATVSVAVHDGLFDLQLHQRGMLASVARRRIVRRHTAIPVVGRRAVQPAAAVADGAQRAGDVTAPRPAAAVGHPRSRPPPSRRRSSSSPTRARCWNSSPPRPSPTPTPTARGGASAVQGSRRDARSRVSGLLTTPPWEWGKR